MPHTEVIMPLTKSTALYGSYELPSKIIKIDKKALASRNFRTYSFAERFIFSNSADFMIELAGKVAGKEQLIRQIGKNKKQAS